MSVLKYCLLSFIFFVGITKNVFSGIHIYFFDVGQGNCILLRNETNAILIDAGGSKSFDSIKESFERCLGTAKIVGIILTHPDKDHRNLINSIMEKHKKERFFLFSVVLKGRYLVTNRGKKEYSPKILKSWQDKLNKLFPEGEFKFLKANWGKFPGRRLTSNDTCLVFSFKYNKVKTLFTGDSTGKAFDHYVGQYTGAGITNDYWKDNRGIIDGTHIFVMPHHGSDQDGSWRWTLNVTKENPNLLATIINVDPEESPYGHPRAWIRDVTWPSSMSMKCEQHEVCYTRTNIIFNLKTNDSLFTTGSHAKDHFIEILIDKKGVQKKKEGEEGFVFLGKPVDNTQDGKVVAGTPLKRPKCTTDF